MDAKRFVATLLAKSEAIWRPLAEPKSKPLLQPARLRLPLYLGRLRVEVVQMWNLCDNLAILKVAFSSNPDVLFIH